MIKIIGAFVATTLLMATTVANAQQSVATTPEDAKLDALFPGTNPKAASLSPGSFSDLAGMTCKGKYAFGIQDHHWSQGALWFQPDQHGRFMLRSKLGREALEAYDKVTSPDGYNYRAKVQMTRKGTTLEFSDAEGIVYTLTPTGLGQYDLYMTWDNGNGPWHGNIKCAW